MSADPEDSQEAPIVAAANCAVAAGVLTTNKSRGMVVARTGAGVFTLTVNPAAVNGDTVTQQGNLAGGIPASSLVCEIQATGGGAAPWCTIVNTSDTVKTVNFFDAAGVAADPAGFEAVLKRLL
jgi:hypothetical protein